MFRGQFKKSAHLWPTVRDVKRLLVEYLREAVIDAKGNVVSFNLKKVKKALEAESKAEEIALKAALEALVD
jgi:hypothetical protein